MDELKCMIALVSLWLQEEAKKKKKNKIVLRAERETDVMGLADAASGGYDDFLDDDFM